MNHHVFEPIPRHRCSLSEMPTSPYHGCMVNHHKNKGARYERQAVPFVLGLLPEFSVNVPGRKLGEGRMLDTGDLDVLPDTAIQVKAWRDMVAAVWASAEGAQKQAKNGMLPCHVGMVWVVRSRSNQVQWLFTTTEWPVKLNEDNVFITGLPSKAMAHVRNDDGPSRDARIALVRRAKTPDLYVSTGEAWAAAYRDMHTNGQRFDTAPGCVA